MTTAIAKLEHGFTGGLLATVPMTAAMLIAQKLGLLGKAPPAKLTPSPSRPRTSPPADTTPADTKPADTQPVAAGDLPAECGEYKAAIEKLATCDKLPRETRDALKQSYEQTSTAWASVPAEGKAALATACKSAADAVKQSATACQ